MSDWREVGYSVGDRVCVYIYIYIYWLVVSTPLKNLSQLG